MSQACRRLGTRRSRLVFFAPSPSEPGGAQRRAQLLADALAERGWKVLIIGRSVGAKRFSLRRHGPVQVLEVPGYGRRRLGALAFLATGVFLGIAAGIRGSGYMALQLSSPATAAALCGLVARKPFVVMSSTSGALSETALLRGRGRGAARRALLRRAAQLVGQTDEAVRELSSVLPGTPVVALPNPVAAVPVPPLSGAARVAFSGRLSEEKDLPRLLTAWEVLVSERPHACLTLIGAGSAHRSVESELRATVARRPGLRASVRFTGWLPDPSPEVAAADVFVFPSLSEGMSNALLEACALGRVVVASDIEANVEILGSGYPLLFAAGDADELLGALRRALDDDALRVRCRELIAERLDRFSPVTIAGRLELAFLDADRTRHQ